MRRARFAVVGGTALLLAACSTVQFGRDFDPQLFDSRVERGVTTREAVRRWLGVPVAQGAAVDDTGARFEEWTYYYGHGQLPNLQDARVKFLQIRFDGQGRVASYSWTGERAE